MKKAAALSLMLFVMAPAACLAQTLQQTQPIAGSVQINDYDTSSVRINRNTLRSGVNSTDFSGSLLPQQPQVAPLLDARTFQGAVNTIKRLSPLLTSGATTNSTATPQVGAPYIWYQSAFGGYYDASGTTKELVRADRLYLFGGRFEDGTPVPKEPITDMNAMGHAFRQQKLPTQHFWSH